MNGIIEVSRSIGDGAYKSLGVSCVPDMKRLTLTRNDRLVNLFVSVYPFKGPLFTSFIFRDESTRGLDFTRIIATKVVYLIEKLILVCINFKNSNQIALFIA